MNIEATLLELVLANGSVGGLVLVTALWARSEFRRTMDVIASDIKAVATRQNDIEDRVERLERRIDTIPPAPMVPRPERPSRPAEQPS